MEHRLTILKFSDPFQNCECSYFSVFWLTNLSKGLKKNQETFEVNILISI